MSLKSIAKIRLVTIDDAEFIYQLRNRQPDNGFISLSDKDSVQQQKKWIESYKDRESVKLEFYFIITDEQNKSYGTVRIYNIDYKQKSCCWGSWVLSEDRPEGFSYLSIIESFTYIFSTLNLEKSFIDVHKNNHKANHIYQKIGSTFLNAQNDTICYEYDKKAFENFKNSYLKTFQTKKYKVLDFNQLGDERGYLVVAESNKDIPFEIKRVFYMYGTKDHVVRGQHANRKSQFVLINLQGACKILCDDGVNQDIIVLDKPHKAVYSEKMVWKNMYDFSPDTILLVFSNEYYDSGEYIRDYSEFKAEVQNSL